MKKNNQVDPNMFIDALKNAKVIFDLLRTIPCEGVKYELRYLSAWITIHARKVCQEDCFLSERRRCLKNIIGLSAELLKCLKYTHDSGYISTQQYRSLEEDYRSINAQVGQLGTESVAHRWLGRIIKLYHGEKTKKGGSAYENNDRFSIDGGDGLVRFSRVRAKRLRYEERKEIPSSRV